MLSIVDMGGDFHVVPVRSMTICEKVVDLDLSRTKRGKGCRKWIRREGCIDRSLDLFVLCFDVLIKTTDKQGDIGGVLFELRV